MNSGDVSMKAPPALLVRLESIKRDTELYPEKEVESEHIEWNPPASLEKCVVQVTGNIEIAVFIQHASQDRHWHKIGTEIYTVLEGEMKIEVEGQDFVLRAGDTIVVNPGAIHEVKPEGTEFICQVVTANCGGHADKYLATQ
jgi:quercetin dioxygenase-like cupin family protein